MRRDVFVCPKSGGDATLCVCVFILGKKGRRRREDLTILESTETADSLRLSLYIASLLVISSWAFHRLEAAAPCIYSYLLFELPIPTCRLVDKLSCQKKRSFLPWLLKGPELISNTVDLFPSSFFSRRNGELKRKMVFKRQKKKKKKAARYLFCFLACDGFYFFHHRSVQFKVTERQT